MVFKYITLLYNYNFLKMRITELLKMIAETAGSTAKKAILAEQNTELLTEIFDYTYGGRKYFVKKYFVSAEGPLTIEDDWPAIKAMLDTLAAKTVTGNAALSLIDNVVSGFTKDDQEVIQHIIEGNLKCGVTLKTFEAATGTTSAATSNALPVALAINLDKVKGVNPIDGTFYASRKLDGCVSGDTLITMADGSLKTIKELVETNSHENVLTYNTSTGKTEACKILNHLKNGEDIKEKTHQWYEIELEDGRKIKVTGNHRIYIPALNCYRRVDELKGDEEFFII